MITELPWEIGGMQLNILEVSHNPLVIPPTSVVNRGTAAILEWLKKNEKTGRSGKVSGLGITPNND